MSNRNNAGDYAGALAELADDAAPPDPAPARTPVPVVGIGASAGGLEPISELLAAVPPGNGFAYVVVQHLDPQHTGMLPELLQRVTAMPVLEAADGMLIEPASVYVIPPDRDLGYARGALRVAKQQRRPGQCMPIDHFFQELAADCGPLATGVVLSGMGSDGSAGLRAIQEHGGLTLAQQPPSARFAAMPQSAIDGGTADIVALPTEMPALIEGRHLHRQALHMGPGAVRKEHKSALGDLLQYLLARTGNDFADYKMNTVMRRIERRMALHQRASLDEYMRLLQDNPGEVQLLFKEMLIGVTNFFRDQKVWEQLKTLALPQLLAAHPDGAAFKAWVPACSTGEEAYSLAMVFCEAVEHISPKNKYSLQIFATDLDPGAIDRARNGVFAHSVEADVSPERLQRFFVADEQGYRVRKELRNMIIFAQQNIISDPPFTKLDVLSCRNLLIYFSPKLQQRLIPLFHYALKAEGMLLLGSADTPGQFTDLFAPMPGVSRIYQRLDASTQRLVHYFPTKVAAVAPIQNEARSASMSGNLQSQVEQLLLKKHTPAAVLLNHDGDILYIHGRTGVYLEPAAGKANWNIHAMARDGLRYELDDLLQRAVRSEGPQILRGLVMKDAGGQELAVDLSAEAAGEADALEGMVLVTFASAPRPAGRRSRPASPRLTELEQQLAQARLEIQTVRDEMQTSREELRSANEELQSTNEELQSTNEELTTSKEEMQSLNEELYTVNAELQSKVDDLSLVNSDMKNLLNSTDIATIFLDNTLRIRRYTTQASQLYKLIPGDVQRPLSDIASDLVYPEIEDDAGDVLRTLVFSEKEIPTRNGRWFTVRIMPYRTVDNVIDGLVLTFINITAAKELESRLRALNPPEDVRDGGAK
ncbi:PAS domain-containing protein [Pseudoduganella sp. LjRoot289]|uniref:chemotaxis protein CheB n=1 Tax=Pseudoduganella sp. LjRoot289 TaxID=3342314 RepID=UPI003ECECE26